MGNEKEDRSSAFGGRKRLRENGSQTDEDEHVAAMTHGEAQQMLVLTT